MRFLKKGNRVHIGILLIVFALLSIYYMCNLANNNNVIASENVSVNELLSLKHTLRFNEDGKFKIVIFSDIQETIPVKDSTIQYMNKILDTEKPDLVLLGGDNFDGSGNIAKKLKEYLTIITEPMESRKIPWCHVYVITLRVHTVILME